MGIQISNKFDHFTQRDYYLSQFRNVDFKFGKIQKSLAWPLVNSLISTGEDQKSSHLFQIQHNWNILLQSEIEPLIENWGRSEFAQEDTPYSFNPQTQLKLDEYQIRREQLEQKLLSNELPNDFYRKHILATRTHFSGKSIIPTNDEAAKLTCECGRVSEREGSQISDRFNNSLYCSYCGTKAQIRETNVEKEQIASSLLIPYTFSFFEFVVNDSYWLVEIAEQQNKTAVVKYYFYLEKEWLQVTFREFVENPIFKLLKGQVIGALVALETKVASKRNHEDARKSLTPTMMQRLKTVYKKEFNFGYSIIDLTKQTKKQVLEEEHEPRWKVRLHFRRGFWRTRLGKQERVRWCLVGDPSLGFIDKHYRF